jgi:hypothetical protein
MAITQDFNYFFLLDPARRGQNFLNQTSIPMVLTQLGSSLDHWSSFNQHTLKFLGDILWTISAPFPLSL